MNPKRMGEFLSKTYENVDALSSFIEVHNFIYVEISPKDENTALSISPPMIYSSNNYFIGSQSTIMGGVFELKCDEYKGCSFIESGSFYAFQVSALGGCIKC